MITAIGASDIVATEGIHGSKNRIERAPLRSRVH